MAKRSLKSFRVDLGDDFLYVSWYQNNSGWKYGIRSKKIEFFKRSSGSFQLNYFSCLSCWNHYDHKLKVAHTDVPLGKSRSETPNLENWILTCPPKEGAQQKWATQRLILYQWQKWKQRQCWKKRGKIATKASSKKEKFLSCIKWITQHIFVWEKQKKKKREKWIRFSTLQFWQRFRLSFELFFAQFYEIVSSWLINVYNPRFDEGEFVWQKIFFENEAVQKPR